MILLADWTDKEMLVAIGSTVVAMVPVCIFILPFLVRPFRHRAKKAEAELKEIKAQLDEVSVPSSPSLDEIQTQ